MARRFGTTTEDRLALGWEADDLERGDVFDSEKEVGEITTIVRGDHALGREIGWDVGYVAETLAFHRRGENVGQPRL